LAIRKPPRAILEALPAILSILDKSVIYVAAVLPRAVKFQRTPAETSKPRNSGLSSRGAISRRGDVSQFAKRAWFAKEVLKKPPRIATLVNLEVMDYI